MQGRRKTRPLPSTSSWPLVARSRPRGRDRPQRLRERARALTFTSTSRPDAFSKLELELRRGGLLKED